MKFSELNLEPTLYSAIEKLGYQECTPIQQAIIPHVLAGRDVSGLAQTGTGKTAAFVIPLTDRILKKSFPDWRPQNFILVLVPTRELAEQVCENIESLNKDSGLTAVAVYGGTGYDKQKEAFRNHVDFVVATPGRLIELYKEHAVDLKQVRAVVFDEADRMFDMGFKDDMKYVLQRVPRDRQFLVFSATLNFDVLNTAYEFGAEPIEVDVSRDQARAENVIDEIFHVAQEEKSTYLISLLKKHNPRQAIIFSNFKVNVEKVAAFLTDNEIPAMAISSLLTQAQRNRVIEQFKADNEKNILVATDVAARGLDVKGVDMVINMELPNDPESYVHRIGRTGRAGAEGKAFSLVSDKDVDSLQRIEEYLKHKLAVGWMEESDLIRTHKPFPNDDEFVSDRGPQERGHRPFRSRQGPDRNDRQERRPRPDRRDFRGPPQKRVEGRPEHSKHKGPRPQGQGQGPGGHKPRHPQHANGHAKHAHNGQRKFDKNSPQYKSNAGGNRPQQRRPHHPHHQNQQRTTTAAPSLVAKVSGFFKKLLGD